MSQFQIDGAVPSERELGSLTYWSMVAFAARCARRAEPLIAASWPEVQEWHLQRVRQAIEFTEQSAATATRATHAARHLADMVVAIENEPERVEAYHALHASANGVGTVAHPDEAIQAAYWTAHDTYGASPTPEMSRSIWEDFELLKEASAREQWTAGTPVGPDFFALHSRFDTSILLPDQTIIDISSIIDAHLIDYFCRYPQRMLDLTPQQFEELIAELFNGFGFMVELTSPTRDWGRDIIAVKNLPSKLRYLIECKRYAPENKVGIAIVQRLHGVTVADGANKGIVATTSSFTDPALRALGQAPWLLEGRDFHGVLEWLRHYQQGEMMRIAKS